MNAVAAAIEALRAMTPDADHPAQGHFFAPGLYVREIHLSKDSAVLTHRHTEDHVSILAKGEVELWAHDRVERLVAPAVVTIKAHTDHAIAAITDVIWYCIHATDKVSPDEVDAVTICKGDCRACGGH